VEERQQGEGESASETSENVGGVGGRGLMLSPHHFNMKDGEEESDEEEGGGAEFPFTHRPAGQFQLYKVRWCVSCDGSEELLSFTLQIQTQRVVDEFKRTVTV